MLLLFLVWDIIFAKLSSMYNADEFFELLLDSERVPDLSTHDTLLSTLRDDFELRTLVWDIADSREKWPQILLDATLIKDARSLVQDFASCHDLESGMCLLPLIENPHRDCRDSCAESLDGIAEYAGDLDSSIDIAHLLSSEFGFGGDRRHYNDPKNSFLPDVLLNRLGLPIILTSIWLLICRRKNISAAAIAVPGHVYGLCNGLYIDCFDGARLISDSELHMHFEGYPTEAITRFLTPASDRLLLQRMARNLVNSYHSLNDPLRTEIALRLSACMPEN